MPNREDSLLLVQCTQETLPFHPFSGRSVQGRFDRGAITSDGSRLLLDALRRLRLRGTELAPAQCGTLRLKLLQVGALIRITVRNVWVSLPSGYPFAALFHHVLGQLQRAAPLRSSASVRTTEPNPQRFLLAPQLTPNPLLTNVPRRGEKSGLSAC